MGQDKLVGRAAVFAADDLALDSVRGYGQLSAAFVAVQSVHLLDSWLEVWERVI